MDKIFTITEHRLIRSLLASKSNSQIADIIGCSEPQMDDYIRKLSGIGKRPAVKKVKEKVLKPVSVKKLQRDAEKARKQAETKLKAERSNDDHRRQQARRKAESRTSFKTIPFDPAGKIQVRLNSKTQVWVTPGTDIEALKKKLRIS